MLQVFYQPFKTTYLVDIGNTSIGLALYQNQSIQFIETFYDTASFLAWLDATCASNSEVCFIIASVVPDTNKKIKTNNLFPKAINEALIKYSLTRNPSMIGKQEIPGANEGSNIIKVLLFSGFLSILVSFKINGLKRKMKRFKAIPIMGK